MIVDPTAFATAPTATAPGSPPDAREAGKPCSWRALKKQQTREAIHDAAYALVAERGYAHVTVADICAGANVSDRTFFNYFPSKAAATLGLPDTVIGDEARQRFLDGTGSLVADLCELLAHLADHRDDHLARVRVLTKCEPGLLAALHHWTTDVRHQVLELAETRGSAEEARLAVSLVLIALDLHADSSYTSSPPTADSLRETIGRLATIAARAG